MEIREKTCPLLPHSTWWSKHKESQAHYYTGKITLTSTFHISTNPLPALTGQLIWYVLYWYRPAVKARPKLDKSLFRLATSTCWMIHYPLWGTVWEVVTYAHMLMVSKSELCNVTLMVHFRFQSFMILDLVCSPHCRSRDLLFRRLSCNKFF